MRLVASAARHHAGAGRCLLRYTPSVVDVVLQHQVRASWPTPNDSLAFAIAWYAHLEMQNTVAVQPRLRLCLCLRTYSPYVGQSMTYPPTYSPTQGGFTALATARYARLLKLSKIRLNHFIEIRLSSSFRNLKSTSYKTRGLKKNRNRKSLTYKNSQDFTHFLHDYENFE